MRRRDLIVLVGFGLILAGPAPAQADGLVGGTDVGATGTSAVDDPVGTVTSTADDAVGTVTSTVDDAVGTVTSTASDTTNSIVGGVYAPQTQEGTASSSPASNSGGSAGTSTSNRGSAAGSNRRSAAGSHGDRMAPGRSYHTRFDRLPRRAEILIERIELGRNVRANLRRLEVLLTRSPALRAGVARALRSELDRLRKGGLTHAERRQVRRLVRVQRALAPSASGSSPTLGSASAPESSVSLSPNRRTGIESAATSPQNATPHSDVTGAHAPREANDSGNAILGTLPLPDGVDRAPPWLMILLGIALGASILGLAAIVLIVVSRFPRAFP
jgi:hypothetical protein